MESGCPPRGGGSAARPRRSGSARSKRARRSRSMRSRRPRLRRGPFIAGDRLSHRPSDGAWREDKRQSLELDASRKARLLLVTPPDIVVVADKRVSLRSRRRWCRGAPAPSQIWCSRCGRSHRRSRQVEGLRLPKRRAIGLEGRTRRPLEADRHDGDRRQRRPGRRARRGGSGRIGQARPVSRGRPTRFTIDASPAARVQDVRLRCPNGARARRPARPRDRRGELPRRPRHEAAPDPSLPFSRTQTATSAPTGSGSPTRSGSATPPTGTDATRSRSPAIGSALSPLHAEKCSCSRSSRRQDQTTRPDPRFATGCGSPPPSPTGPTTGPRRSASASARTETHRRRRWRRQHHRRRSRRRARPTRTRTATATRLRPTAPPRTRRSPRRSRPPRPRVRRLQLRQDRRHRGRRGLRLPGRKRRQPGHEGGAEA